MDKTHQSVGVLFHEFEKVFPLAPLLVLSLEVKVDRSAVLKSIQVEPAVLGFIIVREESEVPCIVVLLVILLKELLSQLCPLPLLLDGLHETHRLVLVYVFNLEVLLIRVEDLPSRWGFCPVVQRALAW